MCISYHELWRESFLKGKFRWYGWDVILWYRHIRGYSMVDHGIKQEKRYSPFCTTFPTEVSCTVPSIGAAGRGQLFNGLCVLSQNIINEKVFLVIWFWLFILTCTAVIHFVYRMATLLCPKFRIYLLVRRAAPPADFFNKTVTIQVYSKNYISQLS